MKIRSYGNEITELNVNQIFVFGSNTEGWHGKGAALTAYKKYGAEHGNPKGRQGQSYAIRTKDLSKGVRSLSKDAIEWEIMGLYEYAEEHPELEFLVAYANLGKPNLNGYKHKEFAPLFLCAPVPNNVLFSNSYAKILREFLKP